MLDMDALKKAATALRAYDRQWNTVHKIEPEAKSTHEDRKKWIAAYVAPDQREARKFEKVTNTQGTRR